ncbi:MAG TPA: hypothetical protein VI306_23960 [Pyrinomonadaceae bacterium]
MTRKSVYVLLSLLMVCALVRATPPDQPNMESARTNLQNAKANLLTAEHNKGGHRAKALGLVNQALSEVNKGIEWSRRHNHAETNAPLAPDQPHMEAALNFLQSARSDLDKATADKGGHRANAINLVNRAIDEVKRGLEAGR